MVLLVLSSCDYINKWNSQSNEKTPINSKPIARANDIYLYEEDLLGLVPDKSQKMIVPILWVNILTRG